MNVAGYNGTHQIEPVHKWQSESISVMFYNFSQNAHHIALYLIPSYEAYSQYLDSQLKTMSCIDPLLV